jgi:hypothetical protein
MIDGIFSNMTAWVVLLINKYISLRVLISVNDLYLYRQHKLYKPSGAD